MQTETLLALVEGELNERKAIDMTVFDVREMANVAEIHRVGLRAYSGVICDY